MGCHLKATVPQQHRQQTATTTQTASATQTATATTTTATDSGQQQQRTAKRPTGMTTTVGGVHRASGKQAAMQRDRQHQHSSAGSASGGAASQPATTTALPRAVYTPGAVRSVATRTSTAYGESRCPGRDFEPAGSLCVVQQRGHRVQHRGVSPVTTPVGYPAQSAAWPGSRW